MSLESALVDKLVKNVKPTDVINALEEGVLPELKALGGGDEDHDGKADFQEVVDALVEMKDGALQFEDGAAKVAKLVEAYRAKYAKK